MLDLTTTAHAKYRSKNYDPNKLVSPEKTMNYRICKKGKKKREIPLSCRNISMLLSSAIRRAFNKLGGISLGSGSEDRSQQTRGFFSRVGNIE